MKKCMLYLLPVVALFGLVSCGGGVESDMLSLYSWRISKYNSFVSDMNDAKTIDEIGAVIDERKKIEDEFKRRREDLIAKAIDKEKAK